MSKNKHEYYTGPKKPSDLIINDPCVLRYPRIVNLDGVDIYSDNE